MPPSRRRPDAADSDSESQAQASHRATLNGKRRQSNNHPADDDASSQGGSASEDDGNQHMSDSVRTTARLASKLVRYSLACEYARVPIRRDGIKEKVFGNEKVARFAPVFDMAQAQLRAVCGMEMVELPSKDRAQLSLDQKRKAAKSQSAAAKSQNRVPGATKPTNSYILVSVLPPDFKTPKIVAPSKVVSSEGEASYSGFYTTMIAIIQLSGGELSDAMFQKYLHRFNADQTLPSMNPSNKQMPSEKTEVVLQRLIRQGYLVRGTSASDEGEETVTWYVGPRGKVEVDNEAIAGVIRAVYGDQTEGLEKKLQTSLGVRAREEFEQEGGDGGGEGGSRERSRSHRRQERQSDEGGEEEQDGERGEEEEEEEEEDEEQDDQPPNRRRRVNTAGQHSPMTIRTKRRAENGDPGPSRRLFH